VADIQEISGKGITAQVDGKAVAVGNDKLMQALDIDVPTATAVGTIVYVALEGRYAGHIVIADTVKPGAKDAITALHKAGVTHTVMLTGDSEAVARQVAQQLGLDEVHSQLLPEDKVHRVEALLERKHPSQALAFVGDGINDAPVLSRADIGIAMGAMGSDAAIEAADIVLMDDDPKKISKAIRISRKCIGIVYQNIVFALGVKFACLALGAFGITNMWFAIFADVGVAVIAILNAIRALNVKKL
jgi:Cd2+/Zn2+-exporting ATPase